MESLMKLDGLQLIEAVHAKTKATTLRVQRASEFKEVYKTSHPFASNREIKREYDRYYRLETEKASRGFDFLKLASLADQGKVGIERKVVNEEGDKMLLSIVDLTGESNLERAREEAANLSPEDLVRLLDELQSRLTKPVEQPTNN